MGLAPAIRLFAFFLLLTGILYPLFILGIGQLLFPYQANGSLIVYQGQPIGSALIGQQFVSAHYFHSRPSATQYKAMPSGASNLSQTSRKLQGLAEKRMHTLLPNFFHLEDYPPDLIYASGSGLDPHISVKAARVQLAFVANARGIPIAEYEALKQLIEVATEYGWGIFKRPRVNVLKLNLEMDTRYPART